MKLVILDRDGVINHDSAEYIKSHHEWVPVPGSMEAIARLTANGFEVAVATNQSGIARGLFDRKALDSIHRKMIREIESHGGRICHVAVCPHAPNDRCACRKPLPGLIDEILAAIAPGIPDSRWMVGDRASDLEAGAARGFRGILVGGIGRDDRNACGDSPAARSLVAPDLDRAVSLILSASQTGA